MFLAGLCVLDLVRARVVPTTSLHQAPRHAPRNVPEYAPRYTPRNVQNYAPQYTPRNVQNYAPQYTPRIVPNYASQYTPRNVQEHAPQYAPRNVPEYNPQYTSGNAPRYAPPVNLWFLSPADVAALIPSIPLSEYREVSPDAPVAAKTSLGSYEGLHREEVEASQFHTQDGTGRAVFGYNTGDQVRVEARAGDGRVRGSYSYRDPTGKIVKVQYWDDGDGFHAAGNSLPSESDVPEPVTETPEVAAARRTHETLFAQALQAALLAGNSEETDQTRVDGAPSSSDSDLPPVYDEDGTELRRYPTPHHASLYDPSHVHDAERDAVIISNADLEPGSFNDIQFFRTLGYRNRRAAREANSDDVDQQNESDQQHDGFFYSFRYPAPLLVGVRPQTQSGGLSLSQRAVFFDAMPLAAVHDAQVSPAQAEFNRVSNKPVYAEPNSN